ncbi:MAG: hypothetical protein KBG84_03910 [Planctomycetes bacterium]|nr:hypothetical protein [Planctomycetota bacterium]
MALDRNDKTPEAVLREIATKKIEAERVRNAELLQENARLRNLASELQQKLSILNAEVASSQRTTRRELEDYQRKAIAEIDSLKHAHAAFVDQLKDQQRRSTEELNRAHARELSQFQNKQQRVLSKVEQDQEFESKRVQDLSEELAAEKTERAALEDRLRKLESATKRSAAKVGQLTGYEVRTPEDLLNVVLEFEPDAALQALRREVRDLRAAAANVERAFAQAVKDDSGRKALDDAGHALGEAMHVPDTQQLAPASAELVEDAFSLIAEEVAARVKGKHYSVLIGALANETARTLKEDREDLQSLQRLVEIAEGTELATAARLLLKGATSHQQSMKAAELVQAELKELKLELRDQSAKAKKLVAVAETGLAGEWAVEALQAMAELQPLPKPDAEAGKRKMYSRVVECAKLISDRIDSAMNLGAEAEAALRESDEASTLLEGLVAGLHELLAAARREVMSKIKGEDDQRLKLKAERAALEALGKRGQRLAQLYDEQLRALDMILNQWRATYSAFSALSRDVQRIVGGIEGQMLDLNQPLESEDGRRLYGIVHDLSEHLAEYRALSVMRQRMFYHLQNVKQRPAELKNVREAASRVVNALGEPLPGDGPRNYQLNMARLYDIWAHLEQVRGGSHSEMAVCGERIEPMFEAVMVWASSTHVDQLTENEQNDLLLTLSYVRRLKKEVLGIHDRGTGKLERVSEMTDQFEHRLDGMRFPEEWNVVLRRLKGAKGTGGDVDETQREPR